MTTDSSAVVRRLAEVLCALAGLIALAALAGYLTRNLALIRLRPDYRGMSPLTAVAILSDAVATVAAVRRRDRIVRLAAIVCVVAVGLPLAGHALFGAESLSAAVGVAVFGVAPQSVGQTSVATGTALLLLAFAALFRRRHPFACDVASGSAMVLAGMALLGYLYNVRDLYALPMFNTMALNTATAIALLAIAELFVEPDAGWVSVIGSPDPGGTATRRQLSFIVVPVLAGWVLMREDYNGRLGPGAAMALLVIITVVPLAVLILRDGRVLNALESERREKAAIQARLTADLERQLAEQAAQLEQEGAERARGEAAVYRAQRMEAVGQLTGGIAHDFNNLLMAIRGNLELLQRRLTPGETRLHHYLENALNATHKGAKVTSQLLAFSRSQKLEVRPVEIDPVLLNARELIGSSLGPTIEIVLDLRTCGAWALVDPDQLELAILNLAVNARDAMPDGGMLRIESGSCRARLREEEDEGPCISVRVVDDGTGMDESVVAHAVEPFFTTKERDKGTGLGLAQVYGFVRQSGGDLRIVSAPGAGTCVEMLFRRTEASAWAQDSGVDTASLSQANAAGRRVLVVDDDEAVRMVIAEALTAIGFDVVEAPNGIVGLELLESATPAAAVIDFMMPGMNGAEVARLAQQRRPDLPIVFVSGYSDTVALEGIMGAVVLRKPFDSAALHRALNSVLLN